MDLPYIFQSSHPHLQFKKNNYFIFSMAVRTTFHSFLIQMGRQRIIVNVGRYAKMPQCRQWGKRCLRERKLSN